jgi:membrane protein
MTPADPIQSAPTRVVTPSKPVYVDLLPKDPFRPKTHVRLEGWKGVGKSLVASMRFLMETEVHVYAFSVAVNVLISFYPFLVAMILICKHLFHWQAAADVIIRTVKDYFPSDFRLGGRDIADFLRQSSTQRFSWLSIILLFFTANGIFTPLEVAFNRIWGAKKNRSFVWNQTISLGLIFVCGALVLISVSFSTLNSEFLASTFGTNKFAATVQSIVLHVIALPVTIVMIFLIYWLLPNAKTSVARLLPSAIAVAILLQFSEYVNMLLWPWLRDKLKADVPPFVQSISIIFWSFITTIIILAGAEWAARVKLDSHHGDSHHGDAALN